MTGSDNSVPHKFYRRLWSNKLRFAAIIGFYFLFAAIIVLRRPDCVFHSQFWAEDGARFFPDAVERPAWMNLVSYDYGYFDLLLRLIHQIAALFPLRQAPRVLAILAVLIQAAVPTFIISARSKAWLGAFPVRFITALLYCAMPNSFEVHGIALHCRVHFAVLAALIVVSKPSVTLLGRVFDIVTLVIIGVSGPFVFALFPAALWRYARTRSPALKRNALALFATLPFALFALLSSSSRRFGGHMGVSIENGVRIIGGQFTASFFLGEKTYALMLNQPWFDAAAWAAFVLLALLLAVILWSAATEIQCLLLIGFGLFAMALSTPLAGFDRSHWDALWTVPGCGQRYYFPAMAMLLFSVAALVRHGRHRWQRGLGMGCLLLIAIMGARLDFNLPRFTDYHFSRYARIYRKLPPGGLLVFPINPPSWKMELHKPVD